MTIWIIAGQQNSFPPQQLQSFDIESIDRTDSHGRKRNPLSIRDVKLDAGRISAVALNQSSTVNDGQDQTSE